MRINKIIREKRKACNLTQEQIAERLGVSVPAVSKWEKGSSYPDITILPALARILGTDLNTLLSFREDLSEQEINDFVEQMVQRIEKEGYEAGFQAGISKIQEYPTCNQLIYKVAVLLEGALVLFGVQDTIAYREKIEQLYECVLKGEDKELCNEVNGLLISKYTHQGQYEKAQALIDALPHKSVDRKIKQAQLYLNQERFSEAAQLLEEKLIDSAAQIQNILIMMMESALKQKDYESAQQLAHVSEETAKLYDLWRYNQYTAHFLLAVEKKEAAWTVEILRQMIASIKEPWTPSNSPLYRHIQSENKTNNHGNRMIQGLLISIQSDSDYEWLTTSPGFIDIVKSCQ